jgi:tetratricopeptide (TPR) repeat protein
MTYKFLTIVKYIILAVSIMLLSKVSAQSAKQDSLLARHLDESLPDTTRMQALLGLGRTSYRYDSLLYFYQKFAAVIERVGTPVDVVEHNLQKGGAYFRTEKINEALNCFSIAEKGAAALRDTMRLLRTLGWQGNCYGSIKNVYLSIEKYQEAKALAEKIGSVFFIKITKANIGVQYHYMKDYDKAEEYYTQALADHRELGDSLGICRGLSRLGNLYRDKKDYQLAFENLLEAESMAQRRKYAFLQPLILSRLGDCYFASGELEKAEKSYELAQNLAEQIEKPSLIALAKLGLARLSKDPDRAIDLATQVLALSKKLGSLSEQEEASKLLYELYQAKGQFQLAMKMQDEWKMLEDSIYRIENQRALFNLEAKATYDKQKLAEKISHDKELAQQALKAQRQRFLLISVLGLIIIVFLSLLKFRKDRNMQERNKLLHEIELLKERVTAHAVSTGGVRQELSLNKDRIETHLGAFLGESSWNILTVIFDKPSISNKELAGEVFLSLDGLSSSLRRMYKAFQVNTESSRNKKIALITKAMKISLASGMA